MWLERVRNELDAATPALLLLGGEAHGVPYLIESFGNDGRLAWAWAGPAERADPIAAGNLLAAALNRAVDGELFPSAMPYAYQLRALSHYRADLAPLTIAVSGAQYIPDMARDLAEVAGSGIRVVLSSTDPIDDVRATPVDGDALALTAREAKALAPRGLPDGRVQAYWRQSRGRLVEFLTLGYREMGLPLPSMPAPEARMRPPAAAHGEDPRLVIRALQRERRTVEGLELAVMSAPDLADELLQRGGPAYQERGLLTRLGLLLDALPDPHRRSERVLEWRLVCAFSRGEHADVLAAVDEHLEAFDAPDLRARRAGTLPPEEGAAMAREAATLAETPLTLFQWGRLDPDDEAALDVLLRSVRVAEERGNDHDVVRNGGALAGRYLQGGRLDEAVAWSRWSLAEFDRRRLKDGARRLRILNNHAVARLLVGDAAGLRGMLEDTHAALEGVLPLLALMFRNTLALLELVAGRETQALALHESIYAAAPRATKARFAAPYVRTLLGLGRLEDARAVAREVTALSHADDPTSRAAARLAEAMVGVVDDADWAEEALDEVRSAPLLTVEQRLTASLYAWALDPEAEVDDATQTTLRRMSDPALGALCAPPDRLDAARAVLKGQRAPLQLRVVGRPEARLEGRPVALSGRLWEVALALALHPDGISDERLLDFLVGETDRYGLNGLRTYVSRLRALLPVTSMPYQWSRPVEVDVVTARARLAQGRVREAMALLDGEILPGNDAPGIAAFREQVAEELRHAVLAGSDPEPLVELAERMGDDLEVWERAEVMLGDGDPRRALARARVARLRREYGLEDGGAPTGPPSSLRV